MSDQRDVYEVAAERVSEAEPRGWVAARAIVGYGKHGNGWCQDCNVVCAQMMICACCGARELAGLRAAVSRVRELVQEAIDRGVSRNFDGSRARLTVDGDAIAAAIGMEIPEPPKPTPEDLREIFADLDQIRAGRALDKAHTEQGLS